MNGISYIKSAAIIVSLMLLGKILAATWTFFYIPGFMILVGLYFIVRYKMEKKKLLVHYNHRMDDIIIVTHGQDGKRVDLPSHLDKAVIHCKKTALAATIQRVKRNLDKAKNKHGVKIKLIIFQDGEFINEDGEEYRERVIQEVKESRSSSHAEMKKKYPEYYMKHYHQAESGGRYIFEWPGTYIPKERNNGSV